MSCPPPQPTPPTLLPPPFASPCLSVSFSLPWGRITPPPRSLRPTNVIALSNNNGPNKRGPCSELCAPPRRLLAAAAICRPARATERDRDCGYRGLQPTGPQRSKEGLILVMRPVNTAFMYMGERANPSVHRMLTRHLKGHLIHTNNLADNRIKHK